MPPAPEGSEFRGPGWYCKDRLDLKKEDALAPRLQMFNDLFGRLLWVVGRGDCLFVFLFLWVVCWGNCCFLLFLIVGHVRVDELFGRFLGLGGGPVARFFGQSLLNRAWRGTSRCPTREFPLCGGFV